MTERAFGNRDGSATTAAEETAHPLVRVTTGAVRGDARRRDRPVPRHPVRRAAVRGSPFRGAGAAGALGRASATRRASAPTAPQNPYVGGIEKYLSSIEIPGDDILTVNVWAPADRVRTASLPVLVFVHGGALARGASALGAYDGATFARHGIVYVSLNYRLGSEGFSVLDDAPQNLGVLDQIAALEWVRREIAAFGGDPGRVTAMGHSAGANTLAALLAHPHAGELFDRVILQSGPLSALPPRRSGRMTRAVAKRLRVAPTRTGFASKAPAELVRAQTAVAAAGSPLGGGPTFALSIGGEAVPRDPYRALREGAGGRIPVLVGTTSEEYRLWFVPTGQLDRISNVMLGVARIADEGEPQDRRALPVSSSRRQARGDPGRDRHRYAAAPAHHPLR